jgi:hypothetical protein
LPEFNYYNIQIDRAPDSNELIVRGELQNHSSSHYSAVAVRIVLFIKSVPIANTVIVVNHVPAGGTKVFEKRVEDLDFNQVAKEITRHEIYTESAY